jgi:hypothetical protein
MIEASARSAFQNPRVRLAAVIAIAVAAGFVVWLVLRDRGSSDAQTGSATGAYAITAANLASLAASVHHPIFWLGPKRDVTYEVTKTSSGKIYVRYLPAAADVGSKKPYLTVATYPFQGAYGAVRKEAAAKGAVTARLSDKGLAVLDKGYPQSVHIAYPGLNYQAEVYDPTPARAMQLVSAGEVAMLGGGSKRTAAAVSGAPTAASARALKNLARQLGHPIYWAGPKRGYIYELTKSPSGSVIIRYLPAGVSVGDLKPSYLTVATYPYRSARAAVARTARGAPTIKLAHGGIGVVDPSYRKSIHLAFPGSDYQIEVFDPSPSVSRKLVASGAIAPVR